MTIENPILQHPKNEAVILKHPNAETNLPKWFWIHLWLTIVVFHTFIWIGLVASCIAVTISQPLCIAFPVVCLCFAQATTREKCPVTRWENYVRKQLDMPPITNFGLHYFVKPFLWK